RRTRSDRDWSSDVCSSDLTAGRFGPYGGRYVPETLMAALDELERVYEAARSDPSFWAELEGLLKDYVGRPTPLSEAPRLAAEVERGRASCRERVEGSAGGG